MDIIDINKQVRVLELKLCKLFEDIITLQLNEKSQENDKKIEELRNEYYTTDKELELFKKEHNYVEEDMSVPIKVNSGISNDVSSRIGVFAATLIQPVDLKGHAENIKKKASKWLH
jgi:hypothetical protein